MEPPADSTRDTPIQKIHADSDLWNSTREIVDLRPVGELIQYFCFAAVAKELHFTRASHRIRMDQSAVSRHIQRLESNLGIKLFIRGERRIELTDSGEALLPFAQKALLASKAGERLSQAIGRGEPQEFVIAYSTVVDTSLIAQLRSLVQSARPRIPVRFQSVASDQLISCLFGGEIHAVITLLPTDGDVAQAALVAEELFAVVPVRHRLAERLSITITELADDPVIWPSGVVPGRFTKDLFARFRRAGYVPNVAYEAHSVAEALGLVRENLGVTFIKSSDRPLASEGLAVLALNPAFVVQTGLVSLREQQWDSLRECITLITNQFR